MLNMKKLRFISILFATSLLLAGCKREPVTYRFTEEDKLKLLPHYIEGKILTFQNETGEERKFKVEKITLKPRLDFVFGGIHRRCQKDTHGGVHRRISECRNI